jgi:hypothetical protein
MSPNIKENIIALVIIILVAVSVGWVGQKPAAAPTGLLSLDNPSLASKEHYSADIVDLYQAVPPGGQTVGEITAELAFDPTKPEQPQIQSLLTYVRKLAGEAGVKAIAVEILAQRGEVLYFSGHLLKL